MLRAFYLEKSEFNIFLVRLRNLSHAFGTLNAQQNKGNENGVSKTGSHIGWHLRQLGYFPENNMKRYKLS